MTILTHDTGHHTIRDRLALFARQVATGARKLARLYMAHREASAHRLLVASLSDHQLRDLGIARDEVMRRSFTDPNAV